LSLPDPIRTARLSLEVLEPELIRVLLAGDLDAAEGRLGVRLPHEMAAEREAWLRRHLSLMKEHPDQRGWCARLIFLLGEPRKAVGHCGFHGPPESVGRAEIGYTVFEPFRGRGFAQEAARGLVEWGFAQGQSAVFASVSPANEPSLAVVRAIGFRQVGTQQDPVDGTELVFSVEAETFLGARA
jgi:ribosomal-protein-alanine N-acetyltransferase